MKRISLILSLFILVASCNSNKKSTSDLKDELISNRWEISSLEGQQVETQKDMETPYLEFTKDEKVSGFLGCNRIMGSYTLDEDNHIGFEQLATTKMACPDQEKMEGQLLKKLNKAATYTLQNDVLTLKSAKGSALVVFQKIDKNEIVNKYWKLTTLEGKSVKMADNQEKEQYFTLKNDHTLTGFAGCNQFNGTYELEKGKRIHFGNLANTLKACPDVDVDESEFLKVFDQADNYTLKGDTLMLNVGKRSPLAVFEAVYFD